MNDPTYQPRRFARRLFRATAAGPERLRRDLRRTDPATARS